MPCCGTTSSSLKCCRRCLLTLCKTKPEGVAPCPYCRVKYTMNAAMDTVELCVESKCVNCNQARPLEQEFDMCIGCVRGQKRAFLYECAGCHELQEICEQCDGLYLYQTQALGPYAFSSASYPCQHCEAHTHWRIASAHLQLISADDLIGIWGEDAMLQIKSNVQFQHGDVHNDVSVRKTVHLASSIT